jgi:hypothetical protein
MILSKWFNLLFSNNHLYVIQNMSIIRPMRSNGLILDLSMSPVSYLWDNYSHCLSCPDLFSPAFVLVSTPLQVSPIFPIIPCVFCLSVASSSCLSSLPAFVLSAPVFSQPIFCSPSWVLTLAYPDPEPAHLTTLPDPEPFCRPVTLPLLL